MPHVMPLPELAELGFAPVAPPAGEAWALQGPAHRGWRHVGDTLLEELVGREDGQVTYVARWMPAPRHVAVDQPPVPVDTGELVLRAEASLAELGALLPRWRAEVLAADGEGPFFLVERGMLAVYAEEVEGEVLGYGTTEVVAAAPEGEGARVTLEQADARGDRYRFDVLVDETRVAVEIRGAHDLVVHDEVWRFPLVAREWSEETPAGPVSFQLYPDPHPVAVPAGTFHGCWRLSSLGSQGQAMHVYHPRAGLILSEVEDATGVAGRRVLVQLARR